MIGDARIASAKIWNAEAVIVKRQRAREEHSRRRVAARPQIAARMSFSVWLGRIAAAAVSAIG